MTTTVSESPIRSSAARTAPPVPSGFGWITVSVPSGSAAERSRSGETITQTRAAPASLAASTVQAIIGRPQIGCSTFGTDERIRVPSPAAMINTVGPLTFGIVERQRAWASPDASGPDGCRYGDKPAIRTGIPQKPAARTPSRAGPTPGCPRLLVPSGCGSGTQVLVLEEEFKSSPRSSVQARLR